MKPSLHVLVSTMRLTAIFAACNVAASTANAADSTQQNSTTMPNVSGTVLFGSQKGNMSHLYARRSKTDEGTPITVMSVSSAPLPVRLLDDRQKLHQLARKKAFVGLYVELDDTGALHQTELQHDEG